MNQQFDQNHLKTPPKKPQNFPLYYSELSTASGLKNNPESFKITEPNTIS